MKPFLFIVMLLIAEAGFTQTKDPSDTTKGFEHPEHPASFPGGNMAWIKYLQKNLNHDLALKYLTIPKGQKYMREIVVMLFDIDETGRTTNITVENLKDVHPELAKEGIRVIAASPVWSPATNEGKTVKDVRKQKLSFVRGEFP